MQKKGHIQGVLAGTPPFFGPKSCVFEIVLVSLVGVRTYENIIRPTQNPTLAGMDPLSWALYPLYQFIGRDGLAHCSSMSPLCNCTWDDVAVNGIPVYFQCLDLIPAWQYGPLVSLACIKVQAISLVI